MKGLILSIAIVLGMASSAFAHGGGTRVIVVDQFGNVISSRGGDFHHVPRSRGHVDPRFFDPRFNPRNVPHHVAPRGVNPFNQNGGRNRIGFRR